jgi:hypothetical protein
MLCCGVFMHAPTLSTLLACCLFLRLLLQPRRQRRHRVEQIRHQRHVSNLEDRRLRVLVDRHNRARVLACADTRRKTTQHAPRVVQTMQTNTQQAQRAFMPARCWMAPEMPAAMYSFGAMILPVWPTCASAGASPASTAARVAPSAPPTAPPLPGRDAASARRRAKPAASRAPRPPATTHAAEPRSADVAAVVPASACRRRVRAEAATAAAAASAAAAARARRELLRTRARAVRTHLARRSPPRAARLFQAAAGRPRRAR